MPRKPKPTVKPVTPPKPKRPPRSERVSHHGVLGGSRKQQAGYDKLRKATEARQRKRLGM